MVRTGDRCVRVGGGKSSSSKKGGSSSSSSSSTPKSRESSSKSNASTGGNPVCPRETPQWQKPITNFFQKKENGESSKSLGNSKPSDVETTTACVSKIEGIHNKENPQGSSSEEVISEESPTKTDEVEIDCGNSINNTSVEADNNKPSTSSQHKVDSVNGNGSVCKTPTSEKKRKSAINVLTPKRIRKNS